MIALPKMNLSVLRKCVPTSGFVSVSRTTLRSKIKTLSNLTGTTKLDALPDMTTQLQPALVLATSSEQGPAADPVLVLSPKGIVDRAPAPKAVDEARERAKAVAAAGEAETGQVVIMCAVVGAKMANAQGAENANISIHLNLAASPGANLEAEL